jgi:preprotein translocase subunit SecE
VARDRQRAKQRKARRSGQNPGPARSEPHRANVPGELEHAGEADEFDAALISGAGGRATDDDALDDERVARDDDADLADEPVVRDDEADGEIYADELPDDDERAADDDEDDPEDEALAQEAVAAAPAVRGRRAGAATTPRPGAPTQARGLGRFMAFLRASWAELQRVQWPDRRQVAQATAVVLGFVVVAGLYLGVADRVAQEVVDFII